MRSLRITFIIIALAVAAQVAAFAQNKGDFYQVNIYHTTSGAQLDSLNQYLKSNFLPQLHNLGFKKVGVFLPIGNDTSADKRILVLIPMKGLNDLTKIEPGTETPKYKRMETIVLSAFPDAQHWQMSGLTGNVKDRVYEMRSYESVTEERHLKKVDMFNRGKEIPLFTRLGFGAIFYARVIAGSHMPNLMYLTSYDNMPAHDEHWKAFLASPEWKRLIAMDEYKNTVSHIDSIFMHAADYSDIN